MTPKRFKAVCTETGREFGVFDLTRSVVSMPISRDGKAKWFSWGRIDVYEDIEDFTSKYNPELCQSTGLTDGRGQEVYEGDVLYDIGGSEIEDEDIIGNMRIIEFDGIGFDFFCYFDSSRDDGYKDFHRYLSHQVVIGNKWQPAAELQARAEAMATSVSG